MDTQKLFTVDNLLLMALFALVLLMPRLMRTFFPQAPSLTGDALKAKLENGEDVLVLDVRTSSEFRGDPGHIKGAINLPLSELAARLAQLGTDLDGHKTTPVVVTCHTDNRSNHAASILKKAGFTNLFILAGGMAAWNRNKLPVVRN